MSLEQGFTNNGFKTKEPTKLYEITKYNKNMVLSAIPLDQSKVVIQQSPSGSRLTAITNSQQQQHQQQQIVTGGGTTNILTNFTQMHRRSPPKIITTAVQQNHHQISNMSTTSHHNIGTASVIHSHLQQPNHLSQQSGTTTNHQHTISKVLSTNNSSQQSPSKYVFFQPNGNVHYASNEAFITTNSSQSNGVGNIVIVATEPVDLNNPDNLTGPIIHTTNGPIIHARSNLGTGGDEDLTSLTWLQDKNLIKGIVARNSTTNKNVHTLQSPNRLTNRAISPSIEFIEETAIHSGNETVVVEANLESSKQQQLHCNTINNDYAFQKITTSQASSNINKIIPQQQFTFSSPTRQSPQTQNHGITSAQLSNKNNNRMNNKNHIISSVNSASFSPTTTSPTIIHEQISNNLSNLGATTTVHVGPSGTTTVVEYKTKQNYVTTNSRHVEYSNEVSSSTISNSNQQTIVPVINSSNGQSTNTLQSALECSSSHKNQNAHNIVFNQPPQQQQSTSPSITTTHHPHKKYLREQMNGLEQQNKANTKNNLNGINSNPVTQNAAESHCNNNNNNDVEKTNRMQQFTTLNASAGPINYSGNGRSSSITSKINQSIIVPMNSEFTAPYRNELNNTQQNSGSLGKSSSPQIIYKEHEIDSVKEINKSPNTLPTINKNSSTSSKEQYLNSSSSSASASASPSPTKQKHPNNIAYDPKAHANAKPPYSFSSLIFMAIEDSTEKALPVKEIYAWIVQHFPYFKTAPTGWKNSVRHNLSLNKSFLKVEKAPNMGKGSLWRVEQHQRPNLIQALTRSPVYPCPAVDKLSSSQKSPNVTKGASVVANELCSLNGLESTSSSLSPVKSNLDAKLFPKLSKFMKEMVNVRNDSSNILFSENGPTVAEIESLEQSECQSDLSLYSHNVSSNNSSVDGFFPQNGNSTPGYDNIERLARDCGADSIEDVNAATAMLALKHGSKIFNDNFNNGTPVITNSPSADHTYSAGNGSSPSNNSNINNNISGGNCSNTISFNVANKNGSDNVSTCASSDAAYESSDESHNLTPDELEHQRRVEGVDALLSLSSVCSQQSPTASNSSSTAHTNLKRPATTTEYIEERVSYMENIPHINGKGALGVSGSSLDEGYNTQGYYSQMSSLSVTPTIVPNSVSINNIHHTNSGSSPSLPKKLKPSRLRAKIKQIKRKTASLR